MAVQHNALRSRQRGLSFLGVIFIGVFLVAAFAIGGQSIPVLLEYQAIKKAATKAAREETTVAGIRASFDRAGAIDDISSISGKDLQITKRNDKVVVSFKYEREIALFGPAYLVYRFQDSVE